MNKSIALLIIGVISLAMVLIMLNHGVTTTAQIPLVGVENPLPQTGIPTSSALQVPTSPPSSPPPVQQRNVANTPPAAAVPHATPPPPPASAQQTTAPQAHTPTNSPPAASSTSQTVQDGAQNTRHSPERVAQPASPAPTTAVKEKPAAPVEKKPTPPAPPKAAGPKTISKISVSAAGDGANVRIVGTATLAYKTMHLKSPDRVVVDIEGAWAIKAPGVPTNKAVTNVRIGKQPDKTRIVIDLTSPTATVNFIKVNDETLDVRIK